MKGPGGGRWSLSATKCIERTRQEHEDLLAEFNSLMTGVGVGANRGFDGTGGAREQRSDHSGMRATPARRDAFCKS
jgi:hypothetical protein